jgi:hypothetical protein
VVEGRFQGGLFPEDRRRTRPVLSEIASPAIPESKIRSVILKNLHQAYVVAEVTDSQTVHTSRGKRQLCYPAGWPDITAIIPVIGRLWGIECKTEDGKLRPEQEDRLPELEASGALITIARDWQDVSSELRRQLAMLPKGAFEEHVLKMRRIWQEAAQRSDARERLKQERKARKA